MACLILLKYISFFVFFLVLVPANIIITHVPLNCTIGDTSRMYQGCLRDQVCTAAGNCIPAQESQSNSSFSKKILTTATAIDPREDGRCGKVYGNATCDASGVYGKCCSKHGYCGSAPDHCLIEKGCQSGCIVIKNHSKGMFPKKIESLTSSGQLYGPIENQNEISKLWQDYFKVKNLHGKAESQDGRCGDGFDNVLCGNWANGNCCSMYGYCGNSSGHCGAGCQSGSCNVVPVRVPEPKPAPLSRIPGKFKVIGEAGVSAMHAGLMPNGKIFFLDKLQNYSQIRTNDGYYAMSAEYDMKTRKPVALSYSTNAFCSGGTFLADGRVLSVGGNGPLKEFNPNIGDGFKAIRTLARSTSNPNLDGKNWEEFRNRKLSTARWYPSVQTMPDGKVFIASGSLNALDPFVSENNNPTYEMLDRNGNPQGKSIELDILVKNQPYYMYPFINVLPDGNLFIFVSKQAQVFNVKRNTIIKQLPDLPGDYRTYPNTGGSVMLPLSSADNWRAEIVICGGGVYQDIHSPTDASCGRIAPLDKDPKWEMESMPKGRGMIEGILLPDGTSVWLNGGSKGAQGFGLMAEPVLEALLYDPKEPVGQRFSILAFSKIPRLYHSCALLLLDGTILVVGSNPVELPKLEPDADDAYVTEYRVEQYTPPYLMGSRANRRPTQVVISTNQIKANNKRFLITFKVPNGASDLKVVLYHGGFVTHSLHMGHRMLYLDYIGFRRGAKWQRIYVYGPPNNNIAPPGPYVVYIVVNGIPSVGQFVLVK